MKLINKRVVLLSLMIIALISLQACRKDTKKIVMENPCLPPCWRHITPGQTNQKELLKILENMTEVKQKNIQTLGPWNGFDSTTTVQFGSKSEIEFYLIKDKVILIAIRGMYGMTYAEAVEYFGKPEVITAARTLGSDFIPIGDLELLYISSMIPEVGIAFGFSSRDILMESDEEINPNSIITDFNYYDPESFKTLLYQGLFTNGNTWDFQYWRSNNK